MPIKSSRLRLALLALALPAAVLTAPAGAQTGQAQSVHAGTLEVPLNKSQIVNADRPIAKAMIGNDEIADIMPLTDRSLYVLGRKNGTTSLTLYDARGRVIAVMDVVVGPDVEALQTKLGELIPGETVEARLSNDSIVLSGTVSNPAAVDRAVQLARTFGGDKVVNMISVGSTQQVMLEVQFAEVDRTTGKELGISAFGDSANGRFSGVLGRGSNLVPDPNTGIGVLKLDSILGQAGVLTGTFNIGSLGIQGILNALETKGMARTLARPTLVALSGEKAAFLAGGEFPIPVAQSGGGGTQGAATFTVEFKTFGVSLAFTPTVLSDRTINMVVEPEVSEIDPTASLTLNGISVPGLKTRRVNTTLELRDGESFAIAGLLQSDAKVNVSQLPVLGSIPIIGALFRSTRYQKGETELLIVVTPHLVAPIRPGQVRLPTDRVPAPTDAQTFLLGEPYQPQPLPPAAPPAKPDATLNQTSELPAAKPADRPPLTAQAAPARKEDDYDF